MAGGGHGALRPLFFQGWGLLLPFVVISMLAFVEEALGYWRLAR